MALPKDLDERFKRLTSFKNDIDRLNDYVAKNHPEHQEKGVDAVDTAIRIMDFMRGQ